MLTSDSDVLQKHIKGHAAQHEASERNKRACQPCHRAKTRCAGGLPCQSCLKRRIQCIFENHSNGSINTQTTAGSERKQAGHAKDYQNAMGSASGTANIESSQYRYGSAGSIHVDTLFPGSRGNYSIVQTPHNVASRREMNSQIVNVSSAMPSIQTTVGFDPNWQFVAPIAPIVATTPQPNSGYMNRVYANSINIEAGGSGELYFANFHPR